MSDDIGFESRLAARLRRYADLGVRRADAVEAAGAAVRGRPSVGGKRRTFGGALAAFMGLGTVVLATVMAVVLVGLLRSNTASPAGAGRLPAGKASTELTSSVVCERTPAALCDQAVDTARTVLPPDDRKIRKIEVLGPHAVHGPLPRPEAVYWCNVDRGFSPPANPTDPAVRAWLSDGSPARASLPCDFTVNVVFWYADGRLPTHRVVEVWRWDREDPLSAVCLPEC